MKCKRRGKEELSDLLEGMTGKDMESFEVSNNSCDEKIEIRVKDELNRG